MCSSRMRLYLGRHVAPMWVKFGMQESMANFTSSVQGWGVGPKTETFTFLEYKPSAGVIPWEISRKFLGFMCSLFNKLLKFGWIHSGVPELWGFKFRGCVSRDSQRHLSSKLQSECKYVSEVQKWFGPPLSSYWVLWGRTVCHWW